MMARTFERLVRAAVGRPAVTLGIVLALALGGGALALRLQPNTGSDTFVSSSSASFQASLDDERHFGGDPVVILIREPLTDLVETKDLGTVSELEACLAGQVLVPNQQLQAFTPAPAGSQKPYGGWASPCAKLMKARPAQVVYGPGTFLNRAVAAVQQQVLALERGAQQAVTSARQSAYKLALAEHMSRKQALAAQTAAGQLAQQQQYSQLIKMYLNSGISGQPAIDDPQFIPEIVFDQTRGVNQPKSRFAYLFPNKNSALIQVRLRASLSAAQQAQAISWIRQAVQMPMFRSAYGATYTVSGVPVVTHDLASTITGSIAGLLGAALVVMAAVLLLVFRGRLRLLPLAIALCAVGITFGIVSLLGGSLTMASIAVLPILIGLAVDYGIQFQSRVQEGSASGVPVADADDCRRADHRDGRARHGGRVPGPAALAGADGARIRPAADRRDRRRARMCADRRDGGDGPAFRAAAAERSSRAAALARCPRRVGARRGGDPERRRRSGHRAGARGRAGRPGRGGAPARPGARRRAAARRARVGGRHADLGPVRRDQARAGEHAGAPEPAHARERHRRVG